MVANIQSAADAINNTADAGTGQADIMLNDNDKKNIGSLNQLVYVPSNIGAFIPKGIPNVSPTNDDGTKHVFHDGQQDIASGTWFASEMADDTTAQLTSTLAHEGFHQAEFQKDKAKWDKESETLEGRRDREIRAYKYQLDFYTRFNSMDKNKPNDDMKGLEELIKNPYTGPSDVKKP